MQKIIKVMFINFRLDSDLAKRNSFAHFSAFRPVAKIGDILQLNTSPSTQDSGEICEVSTTVDKDEENEPPSMYFFIFIMMHSDGKIFGCCVTKTIQKSCDFGSFLWHGQVFLRAAFY